MVLLLVGRLAQMQIIQGEWYRQLAEGNRIRLLRTHPPRGVITDRNGKILATNDAIFSINVPLSLLKNPKARRLLKQRLWMDSAQLERAKQTQEYGFVTLKEKVKAKDLVPILEKLPVPGLLVKTEPVRIYLYQESIAHVVGYVGEVSREDISRNKPPGSLEGKAGVEGAYDDVLRGVEGGKQVEVDARGRVLKVLGEKRAHPGKTLALTIDVRLQKYAQHLLKGKRGAIIVLEAKTGEILTLVSSPSFSPNMMIPPTKLQEWKTVAEDPGKPFLNRAIAGLYPPGSVFKLVTYLATPESKAPDSFYCPGFLKIGERKFRCWKRSGHGHLSLIRGIADSCDVVFYTLGLVTGPVSILNQAAQMGLGKRTGVDLDGEKEGFLPSLAWKQKHLGERWYPGDTANLSIGQGFLQVTPLQIARLTALLANGEYLVRPHVVKGSLGASLAAKMRVPLDAKKLAIVREGMRLAVLDGTARRAHLSGLVIAGKTGTAQDPPKQKPHAWFVGYAPYPVGKIVVTVLIEEGGEGGKVAAPVARKLFYALKKLGYL